MSNIATIKFVKNLEMLKSISLVCKYATFPGQRSLTRSFSTHTTPDLPKYGGRYRVTALPGVGIGPELLSHVENVFAHAGVPVDFEKIPIEGAEDVPSVLKKAVQSVRRNGVAIKGNIDTRSDMYGSSNNVHLRKELDLLAYVVRCKSYKEISTRHKDIDIVIIRQNTEGEYAMTEHESVPGVIESLKLTTRSNCERLAKFAFDYATRENRKKVTIIHKANIMKLGDGLFLDTVSSVGRHYPHLTVDNMIVDNCCMQLVSRPQQFDVMVMPNLYGLVVSNVACGLAGGPGMMSGMNLGDKCAVFEPGTRNTGLAMVGKNTANPLAMMNAACDLLTYLGLVSYSKRIRAAIISCVDHHMVTADVGGTCGTTDVVDYIIKMIHSSENH